MLKTCKKCLIEKDLNLFYNHKAYVDKKRPICIDCFKSIKSTYQKLNNKKAYEYVKTYNKKNKKKVREYQKNYLDKFKQKHGISYFQHRYKTNEKVRDFYKNIDKKRRLFLASLKVNN